VPNRIQHDKYAFPVDKDLDVESTAARRIRALPESESWHRDDCTANLIGIQPMLRVAELLLDRWTDD
jgi:hypothetical protein